MLQENTNDYALIYPATDLPLSWGEDGALNRALLTNIRRDHAALQQMGARIAMGGDINFQICFAGTEGSDPAPLVQMHQNLLAFTEETKQLYREWFAKHKSAQSDEASYAWLMESIDKMDEPAAFMARLQYEFFGTLEFNFFDWRPHNSLSFPAQAFTHLQKALPGFLDVHDATHENTVKNYFDQGVPEFQIKPTDPAHAVALVHQVMARAQEIGKHVGYRIEPRTQHPHVSVHQHGKCLTMLDANGLPERSNDIILTELLATLDNAMPLLYPHPLNAPMHIRHDMLQLATQLARVTLEKTAYHYESTIFARPNRFEFRASNEFPPHFALSAALITGSVLKALRTLACQPEDASWSPATPAPRPNYQTNLSLLTHYMHLHPRFGKKELDHKDYKRWMANLIDTFLTGYEYDPPLVDTLLQDAQIRGKDIVFQPLPTVCYGGKRKPMGENECEQLEREERRWLDYMTPALQQEGRNMLGDSFDESRIKMKNGTIRSNEIVYKTAKHPWALFHPDLTRQAYELQECHAALRQLLGDKTADALATACDLPITSQQMRITA